MSSKLKDTIKSLSDQLEIERHHRGHEMAEMLGRKYYLLNVRIAPLLEDAIDALEIDPPVPHLSLRRIKSVLKIIEDHNSIKLGKDTTHD
jgi:hypothetical protein